MTPTGHPKSTLFVGLCLSFGGLVHSFAESPTPAATATPCAPRREIDLSDYAERITLGGVGESSRSSPLVITNRTVEGLSDRGALTTGATSPAALSATPPRSGTPSPRTTAGRRSYWRRRVDAQRDRIATVTRELARVDARIDALEDAAMHGGRRAARLWAQVSEAKRQKAIVETQLRRERAKLDAIIRDARKDGAEPGWFR